MDANQAFHDAQEADQAAWQMRAEARDAMKFAAAVRDRAHEDKRQAQSHLDLLRHEYNQTVDYMKAQISAASADYEAKVARVNRAENDLMIAKDRVAVTTAQHESARAKSRCARKASSGSGVQP